MNNYIILIKKLSFFILFIFCTLPIIGYANTLDDLLQKVIQERQFESKEFKKREQVFKNEKLKRAKLLSQALKELKKEEQISKKLTAQFTKNEKKLSVLENELNLSIGVLGELFGVVKQIAKDFQGHLIGSLVSAELPNRELFAKTISSRKKLPTIKELRKLWFELQKEMTEQGKVTQFMATVLSSDGTQSKKLITRVGAFNLVSEGKYLNYQRNSSQIVELAKQPEGRFTRYISKLEKSKPNTYNMFALDPSRGSLVSLLIQKPSLFERIKQGGYVGLVIILVLLFGLYRVIERIIILYKEEQKIKAQLQNIQQPNLNNPVGQILDIYQKNKHLNMESLEMKLTEITLKYLPKIEKGISTVKILSVLSPLLGLLGTVIGMILTFQSITLFGTGDPKLMAGGISQALMTTVMGLCCAIPLILCHNFISNKAHRLIQILEEQTAGLLAQNMLLKSNRSNKNDNNL